MSRGKLVILSGPSGVGKDTVIDAWMARNPNVERVVAYTTRKPRLGEKQGRDYHFVSVEQFKSHVAALDFLEYKEVYGNHYATPLSGVERILYADKIAVLKIDVQGALTVMGLRHDAISVMLTPPDPTELERRIISRGTDAPEAIERRLRNAREELALADRYDHSIVNDSVDHVVNQLEELTR